MSDVTEREFRQDRSEQTDGGSECYTQRMVRSARAFVGAAVVLVAVKALANGGPMFDAPELEDQPSGGELFLRPAVGNLKPLRTTGVRLVSEDLKITLQPDGRAFVARAEYVLSNPGEPLTLLYGVPLRPLFIECREEGCEGQPEEAYSVDLSAVSGRIRIELAGKPVTCRTAVRPGPVWASTRPSNLAAWDSDAMRGADAWCVASVRIPTGERVPLTLEFEGWILSSVFVDDRTLLGKRSPGRFEYALFPAGWWSGPPERLSVVIDAGAFHGLVELKTPAGFRWNADRSRATLEVSRPDLEQLKAIVGTVNLARALEPLDLLRTSHLWNPDFVATSSSALARQGNASYEPSRAIDNDRATAWCEGAKGTGTGEWLEVTLDWDPLGRDPECFQCGYGGLLLIPGYAKSPSSWIDNGRLRAFRIGRCGEPNSGTVVRLENGASASGDPGLASSRERGAVRIDLGSADPMAALLDPTTRRFAGTAGKACVRLTIVEVEAGPRWQDTCLSEFRPLVTCRRRQDLCPEYEYHP